MTYYLDYLSCIYIEDIDYTLYIKYNISHTYRYKGKFNNRSTSISDYGTLRSNEFG